MPFPAKLHERLLKALLLRVKKRKKGNLAAPLLRQCVIASRYLQERTACRHRISGAL